MDRDPRIADLIRALAIGGAVALLAAVLFSSTAGATQPACTGDRHYDGVGCCLPQPECPDPTPCEECPAPNECEPVLPCPEPPACPPVTCTATCEDGADGAPGRSAPPVIVQVDRCPEAEVYERCKVRRNGKVVCVRAKTGSKPGPRSIWVPRSLVGETADKRRGY